MTNGEEGWPGQLYQVLKRHDVRQIAYVPDAGHAALIRMAHADNAMKATVLTTEEEGVALVCGAHLGGQRAALLMQSSGVGNCVNMLSLVKAGRFPFLCLVTMRGEWGEFNPWQVPMGAATEAAFGLMDVRCQRVDRPEDAEPTLETACISAFGGGIATAVLLGQRLIGAKVFAK